MKFLVFLARVAPMGAPRAALKLCEHGGGNQRSSRAAAGTPFVKKLLGQDTSIFVIMPGAEESCHAAQCKPVRGVVETKKVIKSSQNSIYLRNLLLGTGNDYVIAIAGAMN